MSAASENEALAVNPLIVAEPSHSLLGLRIPEGLYRRRWYYGVGAWVLAALAVFLSPLAAHLNPYLSLTGLLVGFLVGLTGMGGGALMTPILIFFFGFSPSLAIGTDIAYAAITKTLGSWRHLKHDSVDVPLALWLALGSVPSGVLGAYAVNFIRQHYASVVDGVLYRAVGGALVLVAILLVAKVFLQRDKDYPIANIQMSTRRKIVTVAIGAATGFLIGLTSVGSGTMLAVFLILFYPLAMRRVVGTDIFHAMLLLAATALAQLRFGNVDLWMVGSLIIGSVPGVIAGSQLTTKVPTRLLRVCIAVVLCASGVILIKKA